MRLGLRHLLAGALLAVAVASAGAGMAQERPRSTRSAQPASPSLTSELDCGTCHTPDGWGAIQGTSVGNGFDHARTGFPLTGQHAHTPCNGCHVSGQPVARDCNGCHQDEHQNRLGARCDRCHSARAWSDVEAIEAHRATRLPLTGMHAVIPCVDCHRRSGEREQTSPPAACFSCHEQEYRRPDVHPNHQGGDGREPFPTDCTLCHQPVSWIPAFIVPSLLPSASALTQVSDHDRAFPISYGPHRGADCASCHASPAAPSVVRCTSCHAHEATRLRRQHPSAVPADGSCLSCHPGGMGR